MSAESFGLSSADVAMDAMSQFLSATGFLFVSFYLSLGWYFSSSVIAILTLLCLLTGLSCVVYFRKQKLPSSRIERFLKSSGSGGSSVANGSVIAHRGGAAEAPENTLVALQEAKKNGAVAVEVDVEMTKDGIAILLHDITVDRTTDGSGRISQLMWEDVRQLNAAAKFSSSRKSQFAYESIPTLDEAIQECLNLKLKIFLDVKAYSRQMIDELVRLYKKYPDLYDNAMVCSFFPPTVYMVRHLDSSILTALTTETFFITDKVQKWLGEAASWWKLLPSALLDRLLVWSMYSWLWFLCGNSAMLLQKDTISREVVQFWEARGVKVVPWTVNSKTEKEMCTFLGCQFITDNVK
ncbi:glycerophosphodiester phosphodiesterase 1-like [Diadema antillarum]|uniref:glycerophosphodiester phosphodiesterase 1-like n=1 Tax=Diadema antillarum TaxID=105358 RepID=UPI003A8C3049